ncbi:MAG: sulfur carrier protein ThiS [Acidobacteria bacterium]|nr:sulfur carrier protein ThiS [Acidobacteriota bacterium]
MRFVLNGRDEQAPELGTLADLGAWLELPAFGSAIELNGEVVPRHRHPFTPLREGDRVEVVRLVGGG